MRSYFGCITCKLRKLKCDEAKPVCGQCSRASRTCEYASDPEFRHFEIPAPASETANIDSGESLQCFPRHQFWLPVPEKLRFVHVEDPYEEEHHACDFPSLTEHHPVQTNHRGSSVEHENCSALSVHSHSLEWNQESQSSLHDDKEPDAQALRVFLLWHFQETPSRWMSLLDTNAYFSSQVPVLAATRPMLLAAVCALSAKNKSRAQDTGLDSLQFPNLSNLHWTRDNWQYKSADFYDQAVRQLKLALAQGSLDSRLSDDTGFTEEIFAVIAILSMYELIDAPGSGWQAHLGALPLLNEACRKLPEEHQSLDLACPGKWRTSIFWFFVRQDVTSAFVHESQTRLDLDNAALWRRFGLRTESFGIYVPEHEWSRFGPPAGLCRMCIPEDVTSNIMTWMLGRIINFITSGDSLNPEDFARPAGERMLIAISQEMLLERWKQLHHELHQWHSSLPPSFAPYARSRFTRADNLFQESNPLLEQIWFSIPGCAATMQSYHMARILLLINKPQESTAIRSTVTARMKSYRDTREKALFHSREICGISLSNPPMNVRVHSLQPLFVAGQCFSKRPERQLVLDLLGGIEKELGWSSGYYSHKLQDEWTQADENAPLPATACDV